MKLQLDRETKKEIILHLETGVVLALLIEFFWLIQKQPLINFFLLWLALIIGSFVLDLDHFLYWFFLYPKKEDSLRAKKLWQEKNLSAILKLLGEEYKTHTSLIFHHFYCQLVLIILSIFIFTSTKSIFGRGLVLFLNLHLLVDQVNDFLTNPVHLKEWLFARMNFALPEKFLKYYLALLGFVFLLLANSLIFYS